MIEYYFFNTNILLYVWLVMIAISISSAIYFIKQKIDYKNAYRGFFIVMIIADVITTSYFFIPREYFIIITHTFIDDILGFVAILYMSSKFSRSSIKTETQIIISVACIAFMFLLRYNEISLYKVLPYFMYAYMYAVVKDNIMISTTRVLSGFFLAYKQVVFLMILFGAFHIMLWYIGLNCVEVYITSFMLNQTCEVIATQTFFNPLLRKANELGSQTL